MIRLSLRRYSFIVLVQLFFLVSDLVFNSVGVFLKEKKSITFLFFLQDAFLILSLASLVYSCYSTYIYQAGLTEIINRQFRAPVLITLIYIILSISLHVSSVYFNSVQQEGVWPKTITTLFVIQKLCKQARKRLNSLMFSLSFQGAQLTSTSSSDQSWLSAIRDITRTLSGSTSSCGESKWGWIYLRASIIGCRDGEANWCQWTKLITDFEAFLDVPRKNKEKVRSSFTKHHFILFSFYWFRSILRRRLSKIRLLKSFINRYHLNWNGQKITHLIKSRIFSKCKVEREKWGRLTRKALKIIRFSFECNTIGGQKN